MTMVGPAQPRSLVELVCDGGLTIEAGSRRSTGARLRASARRGAGWFARLAPGAGVLVDVADPVCAVEVALAAWWAGLRVAFVRPDSPFDVPRQASVVGASVVVTDREPAAGGAVSSAALFQRPVRWAPRCRAGDAALDVLTSGTTGAPKCIVYSHAAMVANGVAIATTLDVRAEDRLWTPLPHAIVGVLGTVLLPAAARGATAVLGAATDPVRVAEALRLATPSIVYAVPELYQSLARSAPPEPAPAGRVRWWLSSSSRLPRSVFDRMRATWGVAVRSFYCASETGTVTFNGGTGILAARDSVGRPLPGVSVEIRQVAPPAADDPPRAGTGRVVVSGELVASGYRHADGLVAFPAAASGRGREVVTSDLGWIDGEGLLRLAGRADDRVNVGAQTVHPGLVEAHIGALDGVEECLVVARPHPRLGSVLEARIVRRDAASVSERAVIHHCRAQGLSGAWMPWTIRWVDSIPKTPAGKPIRDRAPT